MLKFMLKRGNFQDTKKETSIIALLSVKFRMQMFILAFQHNFSLYSVSDLILYYH